MSRRFKVYVLVGLVLLQVVILAAEVLNTVYPRWVGQSVRLKTVPVDPRSLFRGNYADLRYDVSRVRVSREVVFDGLHKGSAVFVKLRVGDDGVSVFDGFSVVRPESGVFLRGLLRQDPYFVDSSQVEFNISFGIESFFVPKDKALALESELRQGNGVADIMVAFNGKASLVSVSSM